MKRTAKSVARAVLIPIFCRGAVMCVTPLFAETVPVSGGMDVAAAVFPNPEGSKKFKGDAPEKYWKLEELSAVPQFRELDDPASAWPGLKSLMVSGKGPNGTAAEFFCYYGRPEGTVPEGGFPGVVLVHGGGGTAFPQYTRKWIELGFAVIALDWYNQRPAPGLTNMPPTEVPTRRLKGIVSSPHCRPEPCNVISRFTKRRSRDSTTCAALPVSLT